MPCRQWRDQVENNGLVWCQSLEVRVEGFVMRPGVDIQGSTGQLRRGYGCCWQVVSHGRTRSRGPDVGLAKEGTRYFWELSSTSVMASLPAGSQLQAPSSLRCKGICMLSCGELSLLRVAIDTNSYLSAPKTKLLSDIQKFNWEVLVHDGFGRYHRP